MTETPTTETPALQRTQGRVVVRLEALLLARGLGVKELAEAIEIHPNNLSKLKNNRVEGVRWETLAAICGVLDCQPGDLLAFVPDDPPADA